MLKFKIIVLIALISSCTLLKAQQAKVVLETKKQIQLWLERIPQGSEADYGFKNRKEFGAINITTALPVYLFSDDKIKKTEIWRVPIEVKKEYRLLATVILRKGNYKIVDLGAHILAADIQAKTRDYSISDLAIFRSRKMRSDFIILKNQRFLPLTSASIFLQENRKNTKKKSAITLSENEIIHLINNIQDEAY